MLTSVQKSFDEKSCKKKLYIVATPIGNLSEFSNRSIDVLKNSDLLVCENKSSCLKILKKFNISGKELITYNNISEKSDYLVSKVLDKMMNYETISLVSCAGYPLVSDPGRIIVKKWIERGFYVIPVSGSSAFLNALVSSGFYFHNFVFLGFLPKSKSKQRKVLSIYKENFSLALVIYESPLRAVETLKNIREFIGRRMIAFCREITKIYEEFIRGDIEEVIENISSDDNSKKGEVVIVVSVEEHKENFIEKSLKLKIEKKKKNFFKQSV